MAERQQVIIRVPGTTTDIHLWRGGTEPDYLETRWPDGKVVPAMMDASPANQALLYEQRLLPPSPPGVPGEHLRRALWTSMVEHEVLHTLVGAELWPDRASAALRDAAGDPRPLHCRLYEEAVVTAMQVWFRLPADDAYDYRQHQLHGISWLDLSGPIAGIRRFREQLPAGFEVLPSRI